MSEDDGTVIQPGSWTAGAATGGNQPGLQAAQDSVALRIGTRIAEFEIVGHIGEGGFSIVYLAMDHSLERTVALKEYMPSSLAARLGNTQVQPRSQRHRDTFEAGLRSFVNEAKLLAQFDHLALVKVYRFWEANGTAYMVMPYYHGVTLKDAVRALPAPPDEAWLMALLVPLTEALTVIHSQHCYHRDIAPDNVLLLSGSGKPLLLDFGAARRVIGDMTQALTVILKAGYAPVEQYAEVPGMRQGPWTDVYALAAVVYWAITGKTPPPSVGRMLNDSHVPLLECAAGRYSPSFLQAVDRALRVMPDDRTQSIEAFRSDLLAGKQTEPPRSDAMVWADPEATVVRPSLTLSGGRTTPPSPVLSTTAAGVAKVGPSPVEPVQPQPREVLPGLAQVEPAKLEARATIERSGFKPVAFAGAGIGVGVLALAVWWAQRAADVPAAPTRPSAPIAEAPASPTPLPEPPAHEQTGPTPSVPGPAEIPHVSVVPDVTKGLTTPGVKTRPPAPAPERPERKRDEAKRPPTQNASANSAECGRILQKLSLGETSPELLDRLKQLNCR